MYNKIKYFNAFVSELRKRYISETGNTTENDLSRLKVLKLLFLASSKNDKALDVFDHFVAWNLGPVEKDIYTAINSDDEELNYHIGSFNLKKKDGKDEDIEGAEKALANEIVSFLKEKNPSLITMRASSLVDITHKRDCWEISRFFNKEEITKNQILSSRGYYI